MSKNLQKKTGAIGKRRRSSILRAAETVFAQNGFKGASIQMIAEQANLPKTNVLYYFKSKLKLYQTLMNEILNTWNSSFDQVSVEDEPSTALAQYIAEKMEMSRVNPNASKIFALEILNGATNLDEAFKSKHKTWFKERKAVIDGWIAKDKLPYVNAEYLLFHIWASTQHYADFASQIYDLRGTELNKDDFNEATKNVISLVLRGCGLEIPAQYRVENND